MSPVRKAKGAKLVKDAIKTVKKDDKKPVKKPSRYNEYMKANLSKIKAEFPELDHKDAFRRCAGRWKDSPDNPRNQKVAV